MFIAMLPEGHDEGGKELIIRDTPDDDRVEASKTTLSFVVVLASFSTPCIGR